VHIFKDAPQIVEMALVTVAVTVTNGAPPAKRVDTDSVNIPEAEVRAELDRILASKGFANAGRMSRLLRYVVDKTVANQADQLKEYAVGMEVFDRDATYDPRLDSIVRVEAGRLRSRLEEYYNGEGTGSPIRINLPRGGYVAQFDRIDKPVEAIGAPAAKRRSWTTWPLTAGLIFAVAAMVVWLGGWNRTPAQVDNADVTVLPFTSGPEDTAVAQGLTESVTAELARLTTVSVASYTSAVRLGEARRPLRDIASELNVNFAVEASVEDEGDSVLVVVRIVDAETDRKIWVADFRGSRDQSRAIAQRIAFDVSSELVKRQPR
jgi:TolB-like protein